MKNFLEKVTVPKVTLASANVYSSSSKHLIYLLDNCNCCWEIAQLTHSSCTFNTVLFNSLTKTYCNEFCVINSRSSRPEVFLEISQNSQENTCAGVSLNTSLGTPPVAASETSTSRKTGLHAFSQISTASFKFS